MYNSEIWYIDFYEKILEGQLPANKSNSNFDLIDEYAPFKCNVFERLYASNNKGLLSLFEILAIYFKTCNLTNYIIEPFIENSNFENKKLIVKMRITDQF
jgi:hypothetical protein